MLVVPMTIKLMTLASLFSFIEGIANLEFTIDHSKGAYLISLSEQTFTKLNNFYNISFYGGHYYVPDTEPHLL
ncbi:MAG: hypothetical protein P4L35_11170 [Ignavibacteriaceae bacterium]|nr:hypothetical protein [Ignavibacteriaceae bacterium]